MSCRHDEDRLMTKVERLTADLAAVKAERDAAIKDLDRALMRPSDPGSPWQGVKAEAIGWQRRAEAAEKERDAALARVAYLERWQRWAWGTLQLRFDVVATQDGVRFEMTPEGKQWQADNPEPVEVT